MRTAAALAMAIGLAASGPEARAAAPSFDCDGARSETERIICGDDELASLDVRLAKTFATALAKAPASAVAGLRASQKTWRQQLLKCDKTDDPRACARDAYMKRLDSF